MDLLIEDIEGNELRRYEDKAREAAERASTLFRGEFVNALNMRVSKMERDLDALNRSLRDHPFHNERYSFHRTATAEFQPILKVIEISRISDEALDMLFRADVPDDFPHKDTIKAVEQLLEDPDKDFSAFEDYRNFYTFEIHMEDIHTKARTRWETRRRRVRVRSSRSPSTWPSAHPSRLSTAARRTAGAARRGCRRRCSTRPSRRWTARTSGR